MLSHHGLTGSCALRASCGFCVRPAVRGQSVRCIPWLLICGSLWLSRCRGSWARCLLVLVSVRLSASAVVRLLRSVAHGVPSLCRQLCGAWWASCAVSALTVGKVPGSRSADHLGGASSLSSLFYRYSWGLYSLFYMSSIHIHIGIIYIIYTILCLMIFVVIHRMVYDSNYMNTQ